jgi:hypothetical protein
VPIDVTKAIEISLQLKDLQNAKFKQLWYQLYAVQFYHLEQTLLPSVPISSRVVTLDIFWENCVQKTFVGRVRPSAHLRRLSPANGHSTQRSA